MPDSASQQDPTQLPSADETIVRPEGHAAGAAQLLPLGARVGRYRLERVLGSGGMGSVWLATDPTIGRSVALKMLHPDAVDAESRARFQREARLAAGLRHPGIVAVHDVGEAEGRPYLAMEYVPGRTLAERLEATRAAKQAGRVEGWQRLREEIDWLAQAAEAVGHAHREGVMHRDLKPGNVMIEDAESDGASGRARVTDFGIARRIGPGTEGGAAPSALTAAGAVMGTPAYMSPEQVTGDTAAFGAGMDVWALGAMLHEVLMGEVPFERRTYPELVQAILLEDPRIVRRRPSAVPAELEAVCLRALEKEPGRRFANAGEFGAELRRWLAGERVQSRLAGRGRRWRSWLRRRRGAVVPAVVLAVLLAGISAWMVWTRASARARHQALILESAQSVLRLEEDLRTSDLGAEGLQSLSEQPMALVERLLVEPETRGLGLALRGRIREVRGETTEALGDYDAACVTAPEESLAWFLRGQFHLGRWFLSHALSYGFEGLGSSVFEDERRWSDEQGLRRAATEDLRTMARATQRSGWVDPEARRIADAMLLSCGTAEERVEARGMLETSTDPRAAQVLGRLHVLEGRFDAALAAFEQCVRAWPFDLEVRVNRALVLAVRGEILEGQDGDGRVDLRRSVDDLEFVNEVRRQKPSLALLEGTVRSRLAAALESHNVDGEAEWRRALDRLEAARAAGSSEDVLLSLAAVKCGLALGARLRGEDPMNWYRQGERDLETYLNAHPSDAIGLHNRAALRLKMVAELRRREEPALTLAESALADFQAAERLDPGDLECRIGGARALLDVGLELRAEGRDPESSLRQAAESFDRLSREFPDVYRTHRGAAEARIESARFLLDQGSPDAAARLSEVVAALDVMVGRWPQVEDGWSLRGFARIELLRTAEGAGEGGVAACRAAMDDFDHAIALRPGDANLHYGRAFARRALVERDATIADETTELAAAEADARSAVALGHAWGRVEWGSALLAQGRYAEAVACWQAGIAAGAPDSEAAKSLVERVRLGEVVMGEPWIRAVQRANDCVNRRDPGGAFAGFQRATELLVQRLDLLGAEERAAWESRADLRAMLAGMYLNMASGHSLTFRGLGADGNADPRIDEPARAGAKARMLECLRSMLRWDPSFRERALAEQEIRPVREDPEIQAILGRPR